MISHSTRVRKNSGIINIFRITRVECEMKDVCDVTLQTAADHLVSWTHNNGMMITLIKLKNESFVLTRKSMLTTGLHYA